MNSYSASPVVRVKEATRHTVRELFAFYIFGVLGFILFLGQMHPGMSEDHHVLPAIVFSAIVALPLWALYRLIRFALGV